MHCNIHSCCDILQQNGTQEKVPSSSTVFDTLSHGVIYFVASVGSENHLLASWNSLTANRLKFERRGHSNVLLQLSNTSGLTEDEHLTNECKASESSEVILN